MRRTALTPPVLSILILAICLFPQLSLADYSLRNISVLNILMPFSNEAEMRYPIQAFNGCYEWSSKVPATVEVIPTQESADLKCQNSAIVRVGPKKDFDGIIWLTAKDVETEELLKCEARVKKIVRLEILTKFKTLDVGDFEQVELIGYDEEGNSFTTLEGLKFEWSAVGEGKADFVNFKNSRFRSSLARHKLEKMNYQSDIVILKGMRTGLVTLSVELVDRSYTNRITTQVDIFVIEHFEVLPEKDLFLLPCSSTHLGLFIVRTDNYRIKRRRVELPDPGFIWKTQDPSVCKIDSQGMLTSGKDTGGTKYTVQDRAKADNRIERAVKVVLPRSVNLYVRELPSDWKQDNADIQTSQSQHTPLDEFENNWNLLKGRVYKMVAGLFDRDDNRITLGKQDTITFDYDEAHFEVLQSGAEFVIFRPLLIIRDSKTVRANLNFHDPDCLPQAYRTMTQYSIISEIRLVTAGLHELLLPTNGQRMMLFAIGGSGTFEWLSSQESVAKIEQNGTIVTAAAGNTLITVRDRNNIRNTAQVPLRVADPAALRLIERKMEMLIGGSRSMMVSARDSQAKRFISCTGLEFSFDSRSSAGLDINTVNLHSSNFKEGIAKARQIRTYLNNGREAQIAAFKEEYDVVFSTELYHEYVDSDEVSKARLERIFEYYQTFGVCAGFNLTATRLGEYDLKHALIKKRGTVRVYTPYSLRAEAEYDERVFGERPVILPNSWALFDFTGGPWVWSDSESQSDRLSYKVKYLKKGDQEALRVASIRETEGVMRVEVECLSEDPASFLNRDIDLEIYGFNEKDEELLAPIRVKGLLRVSCKLPKSIRLLNVKEVETVATSLANQKKKLGLRLGGEYDFVAELFDEHDHLFWATQSGVFDWAIDSADIGRWVDQERNLRRNRLALDTFKTAAGYARVSLQRIHTQRQDPPSAKTIKLPRRLEDKVHIEALDQVSLSSEEILLFYHPDIEYKLRIENGSGDFAVNSDASFIDAEYVSKQKVILLRPKQLGTTELEVQDLGAEARMKAIAIVHVVEVLKIEATVESSILEEGEETIVSVKVYDEEDRVIPVEQYQHMALRLGVLDGLGKYVELKEINVKQDFKRFVIRPTKEGHYSLEVSGQDSEGFTKRSNQIRVSVFSKMQISPKTLLIGEGCVSAFHVKGGPDQALRAEHDFHLEVEGGQNVGQLIERGDGKFEFRARNLGKDSVIIKLRSRKTRLVVGSAKIPISIVKPDAFELMGIDNGKMLNESLARIIAVPTSKGRRFSPALCPIAFEWQNLNKDVVEIERTGSGEGCGDLTSEGKPSELTTERLSKLISSGWQGLAKNIRALNRGFADIEVTGRMGEWLFKTNKNIEVVAGLGTKRDRFIKVAGCTEGVLLMPPNAKFQIRLVGVPLSSNADYLFSVLQSQSVRLIRTNVNGFIKTSSEEGYVLLRISEKRVPENELLLPVVIRRPSSLIVEDSSKIGLVPVKSSMSLKARLIDTLGRVFAHPLKDFKMSAQSSDSSILEAHYNPNRGEVEIAAKRKGQATVFLTADRSPLKLLEILPVKIGALISPASPVTVHIGGIVDFKINNQVLLDKTGWKSSNESVLSIDDGTVRAIAPGKAELRFDESVNLSSIVSVYKLDQVIEEKTEKLITNVASRAEFKKTYHFMYKLFAQGREVNLLETERTQPEVRNQLDWGCTVSSESLSVQRQRFINPQNSLPYMGCVVKFANWATEEEWDFASEAELVFYVENQKTGFRLQKKTRLSVLHGFFLADAKALAKPIFFDNDARTGTILVKTQTPLAVTLDPPFLKGFVKTEFDSKFSVFKIIFDFPENYSESKIDGNIILEAQQTGQKVTLNMVYDPASTILKRISRMALYSTSFAWFNFSDFILLVVAASALIIIWYYLRGHKSNRQPSRRFNGHNRYVNNDK